MIVGLQCTLITLNSSMTDSLHTFKYLTEEDLRSLRLNLFGHKDIPLEEKEELLNKLLMEELHY